MIRRWGGSVQRPASRAAPTMTEPAALDQHDSKEQASSAASLPAQLLLQHSTLRMLPARPQQQQSSLLLLSGQPQQGRQQWQPNPGAVPAPARTSLLK